MTIEIEYNLLSTLMAEPSLITAINLRPHHFEERRAGRLFKTIAQLISEKKDPDVILVAETVGGDDILGYVGNICMNYPSVPANINAYEEIIKKGYRSRAEKQIAQTYLEELESDIPESSSNAINAIRALDEDSGDGIEHVKDITKLVLENVGKVQELDRGAGILTGIDKLDTLLGGLHPGDYCMLAARTSVGKTAVMLNFATNCREKVGIITAEQGKEQLTQRMLSNLGSIKIQRFRTGKFDDVDYSNLSNAVSKLTSKGIYISHKRGPTIQDVEQMARRMVWRNDIKILFIDYIQKIKSRAYKERHLQVGDVSTRLFNLADELNIPVIALAQLNRAADGKEPRLSDLKESGDLEQDADQIIFLHPSADETELNLIVAKNRFGPVAHTNAKWEGQFMRLSNKEGNY